MAFADILLSLNEEADRTQLDALAAKYPSLRKFAESGETLEGLRGRLKTLDPDYEVYPDRAIQELEQWHGWKKSHYDPAAKMTHEEKRTKNALADALAKVAELEARSDTDMTPEEIRALITESLTAANVVTSPTLDAKLNELVEKRVNPAISQSTNGLTDRFEDVFDKIEDVIGNHQTTFGERIRPKAVFEHMKKTGQMDAEKAYQDMVAPKLAEKTSAEHAAAVDKAKKEGIEEGRRAALASSGGRAIPVDGDGGRSVGFAEARRIQRNAPKEGETFRPKFGSGGIAAQHAHERREKLANAGGE